jgi:glycosyltransferase involved in cell wall biosynthesis
VDTIERVEATLDQIDQLWADLDVGGFDLDVPQPPATASSATRWDPRGKSRRQRKQLTEYTVSVVIPVYNERRTILQVVDRVQSLGLPGEIIVVDDCSTDGTRGWLETLHETPNVRVIFKEANEGKGAALRTGFQAATGDIVVVQDADLEYDPRDIPAVLKPIVDGRADVAYGSRYLKNGSGDQSAVHRFGNWLLTSLSNTLNRTELTDMETCYKAFRKNVLRDIPLRQPRFGFEPEITAKVARRQYRITEVPIRYEPRGYAEGKKIGLKDLFSTLYCIVRYSWGD